MKLRPLGILKTALHLISAPVIFAAILMTLLMLTPLGTFVFLMFGGTLEGVVGFKAYLIVAGMAASGVLTVYFLVKLPKWVTDSFANKQTMRGALLLGLDLALLLSITTLAMWAIAAANGGA